MQKNNPLRIDIVTLFPAIFDVLQWGITGRAQKRNQLNLFYYPLRQYADKPDGRVDDRSYGGGPGMVLQYAPFERAMNAIKKADSMPCHTIHLSPQGKTINQKVIQRLAQQPRLVLLCGRYEGIDQRVLDDFVDTEYSIGDYVLSGGELPAVVLIDAITRCLPEALGHALSAQQESFNKGLLDHPHYTRPAVINGRSVPKVLLSGKHRAIQRWRLQRALNNTWQKRPDLLEKHTLSEEETQLLNQYLDKD